MKKKLLILFLSLSILFSLAPAFGEEVELQVVLKNGSTGGVGSAESLRLFALERQMVPLSVGDIGPVKGSFKLPKVSAPDGLPILLQVTYNGVNYNKIIPPVPIMRTRPQEVTVYDKTTDRAAIKTKSLLQVVRTKDALVVYKVSILTNNTIPPKSFQNENDPIEIYVPTEATDISAQLTQGAGMAIPLQLKQGKNGWALDRAILPGSSQLFVTYAIPASDLASVNFKDRLLFEKQEGERVIFSKPKDMEVSYVGAGTVRSVKEEAPEDVKANIVSYPSPQYEITLSVSGGEAVVEPVSEQEREIQNGKIFVSTEKTIYGVVGIVSFLFFLSFAVGLKFRKKD
ncbi:hypothetical protein [Leptospira semungkisensis]|uniref:hypothetical protein n=1 Tax=Leptospira semungkisensis TaxID=2484985 RepID=UPI00143869F1|nr:hypothetical protein [Leptospira semungkisensis]